MRKSIARFVVLLCLVVFAFIPLVGCTQPNDGAEQPTDAQTDDTTTNDEPTDSKKPKGQQTDSSSIPTAEELDNLYTKYLSPSASVEPVVATEGGIVWDADANGETETYWYRFVDNGDEAPSVMAIERSDGAREATVIDGCYGILRAWAVQENDSRFLLIAYMAGDYYSHDHLSACRLMDDGQKLVIDYPAVND